MSRQLFRIRSGFGVPQKGTTRLKIYKGGDVVWSDDPIVKDREDCFEPYDPVERATARPGKMRAVKPKAQRMAEEAAAKAEAKSEKKKAAKAEAKSEKKKAAKAEAKSEKKKAAKAEAKESTNVDDATPSESNEGETVGLTLSSLKGSES